MKLDNFGKMSLSAIAATALIGLGVQQGSLILIMLGALAAASTLFFGFKWKKDV